MEKGQNGIVLSNTLMIRSLKTKSDNEYMILSGGKKRAKEIVGGGGGGAPAFYLAHLPQHSCLFVVVAT